MTRRQFVRTAAAGVVGLPVAGVAYGLADAGWLEIVRTTVRVPRLPVGFSGTTVALLTDIHHGPFVSLDTVAHAVATANTLKPDLVVLGGDYSLDHRKYISPCFDVLAGLSAPLGVAAVLGNHDYWHGLRDTRDGIQRAGFTELTNAGIRISKTGGEGFWLAGVDDLWNGSPSLPEALDGGKPGDAVVLVSHNPDFAEVITDKRVGLVLSGHTHGGQIVVPGLGAPVVPSRYGDKYARGLAWAPN
ncbi:MAG: metallophosphoesterase, partial [Fimbriiglobus sp.]